MRRALAQLLRQGHRSIEKRSYRHRNSNEGPTFQSVRVCLLSAALVSVEFLSLWAGTRYFAAPVGGLSSVTYVIREMPKEVARTMFWQRCCKPAGERTCKEPSPILAA